MAALRGGMLIAGEAQLGRQHHGFFSAVMGVVGHAIAQLKFQLHLSVRTFEAERLCGDIQPQSRQQEKEGKKAFFMLLWICIFKIIGLLELQK